MFNDKVKTFFKKQFEDVKTFCRDILTPIPTDTDKTNANNKQQESQGALSFADIQGMEAERVRLIRVIDGCLVSGQKLPNILLYGPAGCGKTTLALATIQRYGCVYWHITGNTLRKQEDLVGLIAAINLTVKQGGRAVVFIDEVHGITKGRGLTEEIWLPVLEEGKLYHALAGQTFQLTSPPYKKINLKGNMLDCSQTSWIGATTDPGLLSPALRSRFGIKIAVSHYSTNTIKAIVTLFCIRQGFNITEEAAEEIAARSRYTPREAISLAREVMLAIRSDGKKWQLVEKEHVLDVCDMASVQPGGFRKEDIDAMIALYTFNGLSAKNLASVIGVSENIVTEMILPFLQKEGFVITKHKRFLTPKGIAWLEENFGTKGKANTDKQNDKTEDDTGALNYLGAYR